MWSSAVTFGSLAILATVGCASQDEAFSLYYSAIHHDWTATLSDYGGADAEAKLDRFLEGYCDGPAEVTHRSHSDDGRMHHAKFECKGS